MTTPYYCIETRRSCRQFDPGEFRYPTIMGVYTAMFLHLFVIGSEQADLANCHLLQLQARKISLNGLGLQTTKPH